jgi:hypothetical protein
VIQLAIPVGPEKALAIIMCSGIFKLSKLCKLEKHLQNACTLAGLGFPSCAGLVGKCLQNDGIGRF